MSEPIEVDVKVNVQSTDLRLDRFLQFAIIACNGAVLAYAGKWPAGVLVSLEILGIAASLYSKRIALVGAPATWKDMAGQIIAILAQAIPMGAEALRGICVSAHADHCANYSLQAWALIACTAAGALFGVTSHGLAAKPGGTKP